MRSEMNSRRVRGTAGALLLTAAWLSAALPAVAIAEDVKVKLSADKEVPPVKSEGAGMGTITVGRDHSISGSVTTTGISGTAAHIHLGAADKSGPVVIALTKSGETYAVPEGSKLTDAQYASFEAGSLYINVHTAANPNGDIRGQLKP